MNFDFDQDYTLEDEVVRLRPLQRSDVEHLLPFALSEPDLWTYSLVSPAGEAGMRRYVEMAVAAREAGQEYPFIVFDKRANAYAGCTRFYDVQLANQCTQLGYTWYGQRFQGTGLNRHCKFLLLQFAFDTLGLERVEFRADHRNARSLAAMRAIGCRLEGTLRSHAPLPDGTRRTSTVLSILRPEWETEVRQSLAAKLVG